MTSWDDSLLINDPLLDAQHQEICAAVDRILVKLVTGGTVEDVKEFIDHLRAHFAGHFALEEELMMARGYPHLFRHREEHKRFFDTFLHLAALVKKPGSDISRSLDLVKSVVNWLVSHVHGSDKMFVFWLENQRGK